jgi:hypothetical protein
VPDLADILESQNGCHYSCLNLPCPLFFKLIVTHNQVYWTRGARADVEQS